MSSHELREANTMTLWMPAVDDQKPLTRHEPLRSKSGGMYSHPKTNAGLLAWQGVWATSGRLHVEGPVVIEIYVRVKRPKTHLNRGHGLNAEGRRFPVPTGFDLSNVIKLVEDALKLHAFGDDAYIAAIHARKSWAANRDAGVEVTISKAVAGYASN